MIRLLTASKGRAIVLFTSHTQLKNVYKEISGPLKKEGISVLAHGISGAPSMLLERLKTEDNCCILGAASFWEGVDAVSYTHLDVYKRQVLFFGVAISLPLCVLIVAVMGLLVLAFLMTCSTRFKIGKWWRNSIIYMWLAKPIAKFLSWVGRQLKEIFNNINLLWKGILLYCAFILLAIIFFFNSFNSGLGALLLIVLGIASFLFVCTRCV